ncbi:protein-L-isoaspartate(D-aspartate) O-methyltransferase [Candidatus Pyrohabitans sp.]
MAGKNYEDRRREMVERLVSYGYLKSERVINAMLRVPRHEFVPEDRVEYAYHDEPLPIGEGQTISAPHMIAIMCEALEIEREHRVLEVGTGSGYHACIVSIIADRGEVYSVERYRRLAEEARKNIARAGCCGRITIVVGDGTKGYEEKAPYDRIYVTAGAPRVPPPLLKQLKVGGKLLIPVGSRLNQDLVRITRVGEEEYMEESLGGCVFVPLVGEYGWH